MVCIQPLSAGFLLIGTPVIGRKIPPPTVTRPLRAPSYDRTFAQIMKNYQNVQNFIIWGCPCTPNLRFSKWNFIVILQFFLLIIMAVWNIKQTIMKDYNIQSCQWMAYDRFRQPFLLCTFRFFLCIVNYLLSAFSAKMATYSLVIDNVYSWSVVKCTNVRNLVWRF